ncbi:uncharacterized protein [Littorina saxatilis]|uniref:uncharacterized protein n=1 Tax=Littorina saxatilis TaxID=31220 RepID=UPI0038B529EC
MKPASCGGPCPTATFPGHQQFFHDFILCADSPHFYHHVADILLSRIQELNQMDFNNQAPRGTNSEVADKDPQLSHEEQEEECAAFSAALLTMRLLARFLGLLHYLPYQGVDRLPKHLQQDNIALRNKLAPAWDLCPSVERAAEKGVLALTVPWVVDYLAMMDTVAPRSTHVRYLLMLLRHLLRSVWAELKRSGFTYSRLLVVTSLGWLFDQPCMPVGYFFAELPSLEEEEKSVAVSLAPEAKECKDLVTQDLFYSCCPYFGEMRYLLTEFSLGSRAKTEVRKVNPLPPRPSSAPAARTTLVSRDPNTKYTQSKLLGNFFHMYSKSIHRLVELVSEQNSSNFIKDLRYHALPSALARCEGEGGAMSHVPETAQQIYTQTLDKMMADLESVCMDKVKGSLQLLLPPNNHDTVGAFAVQMCCALTTQKVTRWIKTHVEFDAFHNKLTAGASHKSKLSTPRRDGPHTKQPVKKEQKGSAEKADTTTHTSAVACPGAPQLTAEKPAGKEANQSETCHKLAERMTLEDRLCNSLSVPLRKGETDGADTSAEAVTGFGALSSRSGDSNFVRVASVIGKSGDGSPLLPNKPVATSLGDSKSYTEVTLPGNLPVTEGKLSSSTSCKTIVASPDAKISLKSVSSPLCTLASCQADCKTCSPSSAYCKSCITSTSSCNSGMTSAADIKSSGTTADTACQLVSSTDSTRSVMTSADKFIVTSSVDVRSLTSSEVCPRRTTRRRSEVCNPVTSEVDCKLVTSCGVILAEGEQTAAPSSAVDDRTSDISDSKKPAGVESGNELTNPADTGKTHDSCDTVSDKCEMVDSDMICYLLRDTQDLLWSLRVEGEGVSQEELHTLLHKAVHALSSSEEQPPQTPPFLVGSITQLSAAVVFCQPPLWTEATSSLFVDVWTRAGDMCKELHVLCTSVFLGYLEEAEDLELSLQLYSKLLVTLIERQLLTLSGIEQAFASALPEFEEYTQQIQDITQHITDHLHNTE